VASTNVCGATTLAASSVRAAGAFLRPVFGAHNVDSHHGRERLHRRSDYCVADPVRAARRHNEATTTTVSNCEANQVRIAQANPRKCASGCSFHQSRSILRGDTAAGSWPGATVYGKILKPIQRKHPPGLSREE
jgi:hypothetical protein